MKKNNVLFWHNIVSPHVIFTVEEIQRQGDFNSVTIFAESLTVEWRTEMGWEDKFDLEGVGIKIGYDDKEVEKALENPNNLHVFSGLFAYSKTNKVLKRAIRLKQRVFVLSEVPDLRKFAILKYLKYWAITQVYKNKIEKVFTIGGKAKDFFLQIGFNNSKLIPFAYTTRPSNFDINNSISRLATKPIKLVFIGRLISLKNVSLLIRTLSEKCFKPINWTLTIIGEGEEKENLLNLVKSCELNERILFSNFISNTEVLDILVKHECLILPSKYDGWGAVVNEALSVGTPVIVSNACGSSSLIGQLPKCGKTFFNDNSESLRTSLLTMFTEIDKDYYCRKEIFELYNQHLSPSAVAKKFLKSTS